MFWRVFGVGVVVSRRRIGMAQRVLDVALQAKNVGLRSRTRQRSTRLCWCLHCCYFCNTYPMALLVVASVISEAIPRPPA